MCLPYNTLRISSGGRGSDVCLPNWRLGVSVLSIAMEIGMMSSAGACILLVCRVIKGVWSSFMLTQLSCDMEDRSVGRSNAGEGTLTSDPSS